MTYEEKRGRPTQESGRQPYRVRLPGFIKDEEVGMGDVVRRITYAAGIRPCDGCHQRASTLNRWIVFTR